jgi:hypothetical protein
VLTWQQQFATSYSAYRPLLLAPKNELGVLKFICTTLRPTKLPFKELYNWEPCSKFLSNYLEYEELDVPDQLPALVPAPANTLTWQAGDCFDFSILLCSLLLGNGYDCFVVYGRAPKEISTRDESMMPCPFMELPKLPDNDQEEIKPASKENHNAKNSEDLVPKIEEPLSSKLEEQQKIKLEEDAKMKIRIETEITDDEPEYEKADPYKGKRMHCWVLVKKGKRDVFWILISE